MKLTWLSLGAVPIGLVLGTMAGQSINTAPKMSGTDVLEAIPRHDLAFAPTAYDEQRSPDHYPLVTPRGRVEVEDLWLHGLYRNRRPEHVIYDLELERGSSELELVAEEQTEELEPDMQPAALSQENPSRRDDAEPEHVTPVARDTATRIAPYEPTAPLFSEKGIIRKGGPKIVDVAAALAHQPVLPERP